MPPSNAEIALMCGQKFASSRWRVTPDTLVRTLLLISILGILLACPGHVWAQRQMENLGRGVVVVRSSSTQAYVSWRLLGTDPTGVSFNVYRSANGAAATKLNATPITATTDFVDSTATFTAANAYTVRALINGVEQAASAAFTLPANTAVKQYLGVPLQIPPDTTLPDSVTYSYSANDCSVADLDGDGEYEIIVKWEANPKDNSFGGYTGNVFLDAYKINGTRLWRINLGINIRAGAHYTQFMAYDLDGDGKAEVACKTAPGSIDGAGNHVGGVAKWQNSGGTRPTFNDTDDYRNSGGYVLSGPEFLTVFDGQTGAELATTSYVPLRGTVADWGDGYGGRVDRFLACVAYLDGIRPSLVMCRGYYTRTALTAWDWRNGQLTQRWAFDTGHSGGQWSDYKGQGAHSLTVGDVDGDGKDEIVYGACVIDDNGSGLYTTRLGHGDALHMSDMNPDHPGLEVFMVHEEQSAHGGVGGEFRDARTGTLLTSVYGTGDVGRGCAFDIDPDYSGNEMWTSSNDSIYSAAGAIIQGKPSNMFQNFAVWWDADLSRELLDGTTIGDWVNGGRSNLDLDPATSGVQQFAPGCSANNSTKSTPCLSADIFGDWREEVMWRTSDNTELRIFTTRTAATNRLVTLMHDPQYRLAIAWQNVGYNQPPHPGFYIGEGMSTPPRAPLWSGDLVWSGTSSATWDSNVTANWLTKVLGGTPGTFLNGKSVLFSISGSNTNVLLAGALSPGEVVVHNPVGKDYAFGGTGSLNGTTTLTKAGEGSLTINTNNPFTGATTVQQGSLIVNGNLSGSPVTIHGYGTLSGSGTLGQAVTVNPRAHVSPGSGIGSPGTLTVSGPLTLSGCTLDLDVANTPGGASDRLAVQNNLTLGGTVILNIFPLSGQLSPSTYTLLTYTGTLTGSLSNLAVAVPEGTPFTLSAASGAISLTIPTTRAPAAVTWRGNGSNWDLAASQNWLRSGSPDVFVSGDTVTFDSTGSARPNVTLTTALPVAGVTVNASNNYTFTGSGYISGAGGLTKSGTGTLTVSTSNRYTGPTVVDGGVLAVSAFANGGQPSSVGASSSSASNLVLNGGTLRLVGTETTTNRAVTLGANGGVIDTPVTLQISGEVSGPGSLTKVGVGSLVFAEANTYTGGTILKAGTLAFTSDAANTSGVGAGSITLEGGTLQMYDNTGSYNTSSWPIIVPAGASARLEADGRCTLASTLTGSGTLDFNVTYIRTDITGNWSAFAGTLNVTTGSDGGDLRLMHSAGLPAATLNVATSTFTNYNTALNANFTYPVGALSGSGTLAGSITAGRTLTWQIGAKNLDSTFAGVIQDGSGPTALTKVGTGTLTLTGPNTYTGATTVSAGKLVLKGGSLTGTNVTVASGAGFGGNGTVTGNVTYSTGSTLLANPSLGPLAITGNIVFNGAVTVSPVPGATLSQGKYPLFTYTGTMTGSPSFAWSGPGYSATFDTSVPGQVSVDLVALPRDPADITWTGNQSAIWDSATINWVWEEGATAFQIGDRVRFDDSSDVPDVTLNSSLSPASATFSATQDYTLSGTGAIAGTGTFTQSGTGNVTISTANTFTGGSVLSAGTVTFTSSTANANGLGTGPVLLNEGTLKLFSTGASSTSSGTFDNPLQVDSGYVGTLIGFGRGTLASTLQGGGTLNYETDYVRADVTGNWSAFTGRINVKRGPNGGDFRLANSAGFPNAWVDLADNVTLYSRVSTTTTFNIGSLSGSSGSVINAGTGSGQSQAYSATWRIGARGDDTTFAGSIRGTSIVTKVGTGTLTLSGASTHTGATTVSTGTLLVTGSLGATAVSVASGATIGGTGTLGGALTLASGARLALGIGASLTQGLTVTGTSTLNGSITVVPALLGGTMTPGTYTLLTYTGALAGSPSFTWNDTTNSGYTATFSTATAGQVKITLYGPPVSYPAPTGLTATPGNGQVVLNWNSAQGATGYNVKVSLTSGGPYTLLNSVSGSTTYTDTSVTNGTTYYYVVSSTGAGGAQGPDSSQVFATPTAPVVAPQLTAAISRKTQGGAGNFDIPIATSAGATAPSECRSGSTLTLVATFDKAVTAGTATIGAGTATVGTPTFSGSTMTIPLTAVANAQYVQVNLSNVTAADGGVLANAVLKVGVLAGDANGDSFVNTSDMVAVRSRSGQSVDNTNCRYDLNTDGLINTSDMISARNNSGTALP